MWAFLNHPLIVALITGVVIAAGLVPYIGRRWQDRQKAQDVQVSLITDMSEAAMGLMARFDTLLDLAGSADDSGALSRAWDGLKAEQQNFEVRAQVIGTKLEAYLKSSAIAHRWDKLVEAMTWLVELRWLSPAHDAGHREQLLPQLAEAVTGLLAPRESPSAHDAGHREQLLPQLAEAVTGLLAPRESPSAHDAGHREQVLRKLAVAMTVLVEREGSSPAYDAGHREQMHQTMLRQLDKLSAVPVDGQAWRDVYDAILQRKAALIHEVLKEPMVFRTSWIPWGR
jgi:hypothetical protein